MELDKELVAKIRGLKMEFTDKPQPELLIKIPNRDRDVDYVIEIVTSEFTSLCPLAPTQPDYATITLRYRPKEWLVELKSLKFYFVSFRNAPIFHEQISATILKDLVELLEPTALEVTGQFTTRGGINTTVKAVYPSEAV